MSAILTTETVHRVNLPYYHCN